MTREEPEGLRRPPVEAVERRDSTVIVRLAGELDLHNSNEVGAVLERIAAERPGRIVVDLAEVEFLDSTALGTLVEARRGLVGAELVLAAPGPDVLRTLEVSGLVGHFDVRESLDAAL